MLQTNFTSPLPCPPPASAVDAPPDADAPTDWAATLRRIAPRADGTTPASPLTEQVRMIMDVSRLLAVPTELDPLLSRIAELTTGLLNCERASIFLYDQTSGELWTKVAMKSKEIRVPCHAGIVGHAFKQNEIVHVPDPYADPRFNPEPDKRSGFLTRNLLSAPMAGVDGKPLGVLQAVNKCAGRAAAGVVPPAPPGFGDIDLALAQLVAEQAGVAIQRHRLQLEAMEVLALQHEMDLARQTQQALIPKRPPGVPGILSAGWTLPASTTGGDCFDLWRLPDGRLGVLLADASGHGLAPALIVSQARTLIRALSEIIPDPHEILARVNTRLSEDLEWGQFVTAFLGFLGPDGALHWSSAGHGPLMIRPAVGQPMLTLQPPVQPLGVIEQWFDGPPAPLQLAEGGSLLLMSDGIFEAADAAGDQFGIDRMCATLDAHQHEPPAAVLSALRDAVNTWHGQREPLDDQTIVIVQRQPAIAT